MSLPEPLGPAIPRMDMVFFNDEVPKLLHVFKKFKRKHSPVGICGSVVFLPGDMVDVCSLF